MCTEDPPRPEAPWQAGAGPLQARMMEALPRASALFQEVLAPGRWVCVLGAGMWSGCASQQGSALTHSHSHWGSTGDAAWARPPPAAAVPPSGLQRAPGWAELGCGAASAPSAPVFPCAGSWLRLQLGIDGAQKTEGANQHRFCSSYWRLQQAPSSSFKGSF